MLRTLKRHLQGHIDVSNREMTKHYERHPYDGDDDIEGMRLEAEATGLEMAMKLLEKVERSELK